MKKKIRDLTDEDIKKICDENHRKYRNCYVCPLQISADDCFKYINLDQEIEVKEDGE